jgi:hypothetical protein
VSKISRYVLNRPRVNHGDSTHGGLSVGSRIEDEWDEWSCGSMPSLVTLSGRSSPYRETCVNVASERSE